MYGTHVALGNEISQRSETKGTADAPASAGLLEPCGTRCADLIPGREGSLRVADPLVEHDRGSQRRSTFLVAAIAVIVLVVVILVIVRSQGPEDQPEVSQPISPSERLAHSSMLVDTALLNFQEQHRTWPDRVWTEGDDLMLTGAAASSKLAPGVDQGVMMGWYRGAHDRLAYCLTRDLHALVVITTAAETQKRETAGACPAASLTPALSGGAG